MNRLRISLLRLAQSYYQKAKTIYVSQRDALVLVPDSEFTTWFAGSNLSAAWLEFAGDFLYELATIGLKKQ